MNGKYFDWTDEKIEELIELYNGGVRTDVIGQKLGCGGDAARHKLQRLRKLGRVGLRREYKMGERETKTRKPRYDDCEIERATEEPPQDAIQARREFVRRVMHIRDTKRDTMPKPLLAIEAIRLGVYSAIAGLN